MDANEECGYCATILDAHCTLHGQENPAYCDVQRRYYTDDTMTVDDVYAAIIPLETPAQHDAAVQAVNDRIASGLGPPDASRLWIQTWRTKRVQRVTR